ncbi:L-lysine exporter family protein LysE/ArgO [Sanguibacter gelidistatuariae]|uniref:L-lysine exporter family protein LysE/ArgO n=1 Tax=Sanguibacter gelidistatuariae TaxID=1814289 RepID=A0A1G6S5C8_9MICO|nr:LysE/ArgO family amino acid transporter [Sanguibacter gelidistatuariae]SDD12068.1 L-lysine exporter family protein LysE/ArgO [Sanguibacter gelidistatuariae]
MTFTTTAVPALTGLATGLALIVAIGSQNAYVLRLGISDRRRTVLPVVLVCALSDAVLITAGVVGVGSVIESAPSVLLVVRVLGAAFLITYGALAARSAARPATLVPDATSSSVPLRIAMTTVLTLTWLNPHVYLDTVVFLGSVANQQGPDERWWWVGGAITASFVWFFALGFGARLLRPVFARPRSWQVLDALIAVVMVTLGVRMAVWG